MTGIIAPSPFGAFVEYGLLKTLGKWRARLASALRQANDAPVRTRYGVRMHANWRDRTFQYCYHATYGRVLSDFLAGQRRAFTFIDIGANQGLYSLIAADNPHCRSVIAFEPVAATHDRLCRNIALSDRAGTIRPVAAAVSRESGTAAISTDAAHSGTASLRDGNGSDGAEVVRLVGGAALDEMLAGSFPMIVKVDVEGHEEAVIAALTASAHAARIAAVFYEVDRRWTDAAAIEARLAAAGFARFDRFGFGRHYDVLAVRQARAG